MDTLCIFHLADRIANHHPTIIHPNRAGALLCGSYILVDPAHPLIPDVLYLCPLDVFCQIPLGNTKGRFFGIFGADPAWAEHTSIPEDICLLLIPGQDDMLSVCAQLQEPFQAEQRVAVGLRPLTTALFANRGMQHLIDLAYKTCRNPIFVVDTSNRYIAAAFDEDSVIPGSDFEAFLLRDILYRSVTDSDHNTLWPQPFDTLDTAGNIFHRYLHKRWRKEIMAASIRVYGVPMGAIFMVAQEHPFEALDDQYFIRLAFLVELEFQKNGSYLYNRDGRDALFLIDLLTTSYADSSLLAHRISAIKLRLQERLYIAVVEGRSHEISENQMQIYNRQIKELLYSHISAVFDGHLVILLSIKPDQTVEKLFSEAVLRFLRSNGLILGLSNEFRDLSQIRSFYQQANRAVEMARNFFQSRDIIPFYEITAIDLIAFCGTHADLKKMLHPNILRLQEYDQKNNTEYLHTLEVYLRCMSNSKRTAQALHIHHNTVLYRLNKLTDSFGIDLNNGDTAFLYQFSLCILQVLEHQYEDTDEN